MNYKSAGFPGTLVGITCDISSPDNIRQMFTTIKSDPDLEGVDVLINNEGICLPESYLHGDPSAWKKMFDVIIV